MANCEDLATKAELQELRDQLNAILGEKEEGGTVEVFRAGAPVAGTVTQMAATAYVGTKLRSYESIKNIVFNNPVNEPIFKDFANGNAKWTAVKGNGTRTPLPDLSRIGKVAGNNTKAANLATKGNRVSGGGIGLLANLATIGTTLALNKATVDILDKRIEAEARGAQVQIDAVNTSMLRLYDKQQGDINAVVTQLDDNQAIVEQNQQNIEIARFEIYEAQRTNTELVDEIDSANNSIRDLQQANQELINEINESNLENQEAFDNLTAQAQEIETQLIQAVEIIEKQQTTIDLQQIKIEQLETRVNDLETRITELSLSYTELRQEFWNLEDELSGEIDITNDRVSSLEGKVVKTQKFVKQNIGSGSGSALPSVRTSQEATIELASNLAGVPYSPVGSNTDTSFNYDTEFKNELDSLLEQITPGGEVNQQQLDNLRDNLKVDFDDGFNAAIATLLIPELTDLKQRTSERKIADATKKGICESLNDGGSCPATPGNPNPTDGLKGLKDILASKADQISAALGLANLGANQSILGIVQNTNSVVNSTTHGLAKIQNFAEIAWKATQADKIMAGVSMAMTIHNGMMLSNNLLSTVSEALNMSLNAVGIRDETDTPIDIGAAVRDKIQLILTSLIGAEQYAALTTRIAKVNRIYQSSINLLDTVHSLHDSARSVAELSAEHTGKIGNALRESGAVSEDAYEEFIEKVNPQNAAMKRLEGFREGIDSVENVFDTVAQISSSVVDTQENWQQLKDEKEAWEEEIATAVQEEIEIKEAEKEEAIPSANIQEEDFDAGS